LVGGYPYKLGEYLLVGKGMAYVIRTRQQNCNIEVRDKSVINHISNKKHGRDVLSSKRGSKKADRVKRLRKSQGTLVLTGVRWGTGKQKGPALSPNVLP